MWFFRGYETLCGLGWRIHGFQCLSFHHFGGLKMRFQLGRKILTSRATRFNRLSSASWETENTILQVSWDPGIKGILLSLRYFSDLEGVKCPEIFVSNLFSYRFCTIFILVSWIHGVSWDPKLKRTWLLLEAFKTFWRNDIRFLNYHETHRFIAST